jgi:hypothetical protein
MKKDDIITDFLFWSIPLCNKGIAHGEYEEKQIYLTQHRFGDAFYMEQAEI